MGPSYVLSSSAHACICKACELNARRGGGGGGGGEVKCLAARKPFVPRWEKGRRQQKLNCCVPNCSIDVHVTKHPFSWQMICTALGIARISEGESDLPLCASHYQLVYRLCNPETVQICKTCGTKQKRSHVSLAAKRFLPCPEPQKVELFLKESTQFEGCLGDGDLVCSQCYRYFTALIKLNVCTLSSEAVVKELKQKQKFLEENISNFKVTNEDSLVTLALLHTALHLCKIVATDNPILFSDIYNHFHSLLPEPLHSDVCVSKSRVLTFIGNEFGDLLSSVCQSKRVGRIYFRTKSNPFDLLSHALEKNKSSSQMAAPHSEDLNINKLVQHLLAESRHDPDVLMDVAVDKIHQHCMFSCSRAVAAYLYSDPIS